ncbi:MAG: hypothetical protein HY849_04270 [Nitrosomonadales bacterium]|nr:hypothetical protein [Nitrosomonadales bacterium]
MSILTKMTQGLCLFGMTVSLSGCTSIAGGLDQLSAMLKAGASQPSAAEGEGQPEKVEPASAGIDISPRFSDGETTLMLNAAAISDVWHFDQHGVERSKVEAGKDKRFVTAELAVSSIKDNPALFGVGLYAEAGATLTLLGKLDYRFARWREVATFYGNLEDNQNDFSRSANVQFSLGVALPQQVLKAPLYLVVTREGCYQRQTDHASRPPIAYLPGTCASLKPSLSAADLKGGSLSILKRIN